MQQTKIRIKGSTAFFQTIVISEENMIEVKKCNDAALNELEKALSLMASLDQDQLTSLQFNIAKMKEGVASAKLFNEEFRRSVEAIRDIIRFDERFGPVEVRQKFTDHLRNALVHSEEIDVRLCPTRNSNRLYSVENHEFIDELLKHM